VLTSADKPGKRGKNLVPSPVKQAAAELGLPTFQPEHLRGEERRVIASFECDTLVCFAYGKLFGPKFLSLFPYAALNIHPSLLPALRGPSPIQNAILRMLPETGITIQTLALEMDGGDIVAQIPVPLHGDETTDSLSSKIAVLAADLVVRTLSAPLSQTPQQGDVTTTHLVGREDGLVDWNKSAKELNAQVRAMYPWPKAYTSYDSHDIVFVWRSSGLSCSGTCRVRAGYGGGQGQESRVGNRYGRRDSLGDQIAKTTKEGTRCRLVCQRGCEDPSCAVRRVGEMRRILTVCICVIMTSSLFATGGKVAVVLSGGGARGFAELAVFEQMERYGIPVDMVLGNQYGRASGQPLQRGIFSEGNRRADP
jgi:methionyl-tRNA formyltransferase